MHDHRCYGEESRRIKGRGSVEGFRHLKEATVSRDLSDVRKRCGGGRSRQGAQRVQRPRGGRKGGGRVMGSPWEDPTWQAVMCSSFTTQFVHGPLFSG